MYKLIAIDLDGTLLTDKKTISQEDIDGIKEIMDQGYEVVIATGRRYLSAKNFIDCFSTDLVIIANNGNITRHTSGDKTLGAEYLNHDHLAYVLGEGKKLGLHPVIHINGFHEGIDMVYELEKDHPAYSGYLEKEDRAARLDSFLSNDLDILSVVYLGDKEKLSRLNKLINDKYPERYRTYLMGNIVLAEALLEVVNPESSKWRGLLEYSRSLGISREEIIAIGDDSNDIPMVEEAGLGIAMKNASEELKSCADLVAKYDNNNSGVSRELKRILKI